MKLCPSVCCLFGHTLTHPCAHLLWAVNWNGLLSHACGLENSGELTCSFSHEGQLRTEATCPDNLAGWALTTLQAAPAGCLRGSGLCLSSCIELAGSLRLSLQLVLFVSFLGDKWLQEEHDLA